MQETTKSSPIPGSTLSLVERRFLDRLEVYNAASVAYWDTQGDGVAPGKDGPDKTNALKVLSLARTMAWFAVVEAAKAYTLEMGSGAVLRGTLEILERHEAETANLKPGEPYKIKLSKAEDEALKALPMVLRKGKDR